MSAPSVRGNSTDSITPRLATSLALAALLLAAVLAASPDARQFTSGVSAVEVYVSITDSKGMPVRGLTREDFELVEDGRAQAVSTFVAGKFPLTVALALDASFSMAGRPLQAVKSAARAFLRALRPEDESLIVGMSSRVEVVAAVDQPRTRQINVVDGLTAWGTTTLYDSVIASIEAVDGSKGRRALVILSDGDDRYSAASADETLMRARRSNVMVYPVALGKDRPEIFAELASITGGRSHYSRDYKGVEQILEGIAEQLREQYLLGYTPARPPVAGSGEWRSITVAVKRPGVTVRARDGYYVR
jgi:Ca-activated chloride channel family protein